MQNVIILDTVYEELTEGNNYSSNKIGEFICDDMTLDITQH